MRFFQRRGKKAAAAAVLLLCPILLSSCGQISSDDIPAALKQGKSLSVAAFQPETILLGKTAAEEEPVTEIPTFPYTVPDGYQNLSGNLFAVVSNGEITGYKLAVEENGAWVWKDCDENGTVAEETEPATTQAPAKKPSSSSSSSSNKKPPSQSSVTKAPAPTKPPVTSAPPTEAAFSWKVIAQSGCPVSVSNTFDKYILRSAAATSSVSSGGNTYALVKAPVGQGVKVHSVSEAGVLTYSYINGGSNYVIVVVNRSLGINFSKK